MNIFVEFFSVFVIALIASALARKWNGAPIHSWFARYADAIFAMLVGGFTLVLLTLALLRYLTFHAGYFDLSTSWDLGQYHQLVWNSLRGRLLEGTFVLDTRTFLGKSFAPILLAFVPLYALWGDPRVLLIVQVLGLSASAFPIYWLARQRVDRPLALVIGCAYLLFPGLANIGLTEFHEIALATPLLAYATFFLLRRHYPGLIVSLGVALLVKEEIALIAIVFGAYILIAQKKSRLGFALVLFGASWIAVLLQYLIPFFRGAEYGAAFYYFGTGAIGGGGSRYGYLGTNVSEIVATLVTRPQVIWEHVVIPEKIEYMLHLFAPLGFLALLGEPILLAAPTLGYSLLSLYPLQTSIRSYYFAPLVPFLFAATIVACERIVRRRAHWQNFLTLLLLTSSGLTYFLFSPLPFGGQFQSWRYTYDARAALGNALMATIPSDAIVIAQNEFLAHLANRRWVYEPPMIPDWRQADYIVADPTREWYAVHRAGWETYAANGFFETRVARDGYWIAAPRPPEISLDARFGDALRLLGYTIIPTDTLRGGTTLRPILAWRADTPLVERLTFSIRVADARGHTWASETRQPHDGHSPTDQWRVGKVINDQYALRLPPTMPTGEYAIFVQVREQEIALARVRVEKNKASFTASELYIEQPLQVDMREMRLLGFAPRRDTIAPGESLSIGAYWRAREKPRGDYLVAIQLRDAAGDIAFEHATKPANDAYPTPQWDAGEVLLDWHDFILPRDLAPGAYQIFIVLRERENVLGQANLAPLQVVK
jgi:uncharacterized membrane protein